MLFDLLWNIHDDVKIRNDFKPTKHSKFIPRPTVRIKLINKRRLMMEVLRRHMRRVKGGLMLCKGGNLYKNKRATTFSNSHARTA